MTIEADWVAVDWGTSNLRVWGIGARGDVVFSHASDQGMSKLTPEAYPRVLGGLLIGDFAPAGPQIDVAMEEVGHGLATWHVTLSPCGRGWRAPSTGEVRAG